MKITVRHNTQKRIKASRSTRRVRTARSMRPVRAARRNLELLTFDELTDEQKDYVVSHWDEYWGLADRIYSMWDDDLLLGIQTGAEYYADDFDEAIAGIDTNVKIYTDKLYWGGNSQGLYPDWNLADVFGIKRYDGWLSVGDFEFELDTVKGTDVKLIYDPEYYEDDADDLADYNEAWKDAQKVEKAMQEFINKVWEDIETMDDSGPDRDWVYDTLSANPDAFEFYIDTDGTPVYYG